MSEVMKVRKAESALASGTAMGTEMTCAPTTSLCFQPKPLAPPYCLIIDAGAASTVLWHTKHFSLVILMGRARKSARG